MLEEGRKYVDMYKVEPKCTCDEANSGPSVMQAKTGMRHPYLYIVNCSRGLTIYIYIFRGAGSRCFSRDHSFLIVSDAAAR